MPMARGWESKDVESQVEETQAPKQKPGSGPKTPEELKRDEERKDLQLSRTRIVNDLATATHPAASSLPPCAAARKDKKHLHSDTPAETSSDSIRNPQTAAASRSSSACR